MQHGLQPSLRGPPHPMDVVATDLRRAFRQVHACLGPGFAADIYRQALAVELGPGPHAVVECARLPVYYRDQRVGDASVDLLVAGELLVLVEAARFLTAVHAERLAGLVRATHQGGGLLLNFGLVAEDQLVLGWGAGGPGPSA